MTSTRNDLLDRLDALHETCAKNASRFKADRGEQIDGYRRLISTGVDDALAHLEHEMSELSAGNEVVRQVGEQMSSYVAWMQWSLWDLPVLAVALDPEPDEFRDAVTACGLAYIAIRAFDDVIDEHFTYKGRRDTLLGTVSATYSDTKQARGLTTLGALLLCFEGLGRLASRGTPPAAATLAEVLGSLKRAVIGAMMEYTPVPQWSQDDYVRMVRLKNVDYWRALYSAVDPEHRSPLYPFLEQYYEVAQYLNDVEDYDDDVLRGQPNLLALRGLAAGNGNGACRPVDDPRPWAVTEEIEAMLGDRVLALGRVAAELDGSERAVAESKVVDMLDAARAVGLFAAGHGDNGRPEAVHGAEIYPFSELSDVIDQGGQQAIVEVPCGACGGDDRQVLFRKQGFQFQRCGSCRHVYVSPRIRDDLHDRVQTPFDGDGAGDKYLEVQRIYAEHICNLLQQRTPGARLLDVGFGRGYVLQMAQVYGFEAYGLDSSTARVERMRPLFGHRVAQAMVGRDPFPWSSFDVVVLSHVLEHLPDPGRALGELASIMNPGGWLYVAVPDVDSMDFKIFGKHWDVVSPLIHLHYFAEESLLRVLESSGFEDVRRVRHPHLRDEVSPRWMRLMRQLGGSESSELTMLAKVPDDPAHFPLEDGTG
jgi:SAM-dependent methyltransferase